MSIFCTHTEREQRCVRLSGIQFCVKNSGPENAKLREAQRLERNEIDGQNQKYKYSWFWRIILSLRNDRFNFVSTRHTHIHTRIVCVNKFCTKSWSDWFNSKTLNAHRNIFNLYNGGDDRGRDHIHTHIILIDTSRQGSASIYLPKRIFVNFI